MNGNQMTGFTYDALKMLSEALTQYIDNDAEVQLERDEVGEPEPKAIVLARTMLDDINARMLTVLGDCTSTATSSAPGAEWCV